MANPLMSEDMYNSIDREAGDSMTLEWTVNKSLLLLWIVVLSAFAVWNNAEMFVPYLIPLVLWAFVIALIVIFAKKTAPFLSPVYAVAEWIAIWVISVYYEQMFPGIVMQAVGLTFWVFFMMLMLYKTKVLQATENFKTWVVAATWAIALVYLASILWSLTGWFNVPFIHESGPIGIGVSVFIVWIAALNLILDFDNVETWVKANAPKYMEWYTSFGLLITLIWLYLEILKLLWKTRR